MNLLNSLFRKFYFGIWKRIYTNEVFLLWELKQQPVIVDRAVIEIKKVDETNVNDASSFQSENQIRFFKKFLKRGDHGFYAYLDGKCVHRSWIVRYPSKGDVHVFYKMSLQPEEIFIHFCETASWARGKNIFTQVLSFIGKEFKNKRILISVDAKNKSSIKSISKAGFVEILRIRVIVLLGIRRLITDTVN